VEEAITLSDRVYILTGKPGRISGRIEIRPPRPREKSFSVSPEFSDQKRIILEAIGL
jgi:ABC-type nitrate/sulfonate/bicarbonate transport system ATPase subunit